MLARRNRTLARTGKPEKYGARVSRAPGSRVMATRAFGRGDYYAQPTAHASGDGDGGRTYGGIILCDENRYIYLSVGHTAPFRPSG